MSKYWKTLVAAVVLVGGASSVAIADGYEPVGKGFAAPKIYSWTGFYVGGQAGLATGNTEGGVPGTSFFDTQFNLDGGIYGGHVGYNYQTGNFVIGIEGTYSGSNVEGNGETPIGIFNVQQELDWLATIEARLGYAFGRTMVYARGGWAWGKLDTQVDILPGPPSFKGDETHNGWTAGLGIEHALGNWVTARVEYSHVDLDTENHTLGFTFGGGVPIRNEAEIDTIRVGVSLKFGG